MVTVMAMAMVIFVSFPLCLYGQHPILPAKYTHCDYV